MSIIKIIALCAIAFDLVLIAAYIEMHTIMLWYKKQFNQKPHPFRYVEKISWQRRLVNILLLRKPVAIKQPFKHAKMNEEKRFSRTET